MLSDPAKRKEYDQFGRDYMERKEQGGGGGGAGGHGGFDFQDIFSQFFSGGGGGGGGHGGQGGFRFEFGDDHDSGFGGGFGGFGGGFGGKRAGRGGSRGGAGGGHHHHHHQELFSSEGNNVTLLNGEKFKEEVLRSNKPWLIMYFSNSCSHCHEFAPELEKLAGKLRHICNVGAVNCDKHRKTCKDVHG